MKPRTDYGDKADKFFSDLNDTTRPLAEALRTVILLALPKCVESIKWSTPVYEENGLVCSIRDAKNYVSLQFFDAGITLDDPDGLLEGTGKKLRHIKIRKKTDIKKSLFKKWIIQAVKYNASLTK